MGLGDNRIAYLSRRLLGETARLPSLDPEGPQKFLKKASSEQGAVPRLWASQTSKVSALTGARV